MCVPRKEQMPRCDIHRERNAKKPEHRGFTGRARVRAGQFIQDRAADCPPLAFAFPPRAPARGWGQGLMGLCFTILWILSVLSLLLFFPAAAVRPLLSILRAARSAHCTALCNRKFCPIRRGTVKFIRLQERPTLHRPKKSCRKKGASGSILLTVQ